MILSINIEQMAQPVVNERGSFSLFSRFRYFLIEKINFLAEKRIQQICDDIDIFTLSLEGSLQYVEKFSPQEAEKLLKDTKKVIFKINELEQHFSQVGFYDSKSLASKYKYMQKTLYKLESRVHKRVFKKLPITPTDRILKEGVLTMNALHTEALLSKS